MSEALTIQDEPTTSPAPSPVRVINAIRAIVRAARTSTRTLEMRFGTSAAQLFMLRALCDGEVGSVKELARRQHVLSSINRGDVRAVEADGDDAPAAVKGIERLEEVDALLRRLKGREREIVRLYYLESRTYEEISTETDVPVNTIGAVLSRARKKLR